MVRFFKGKKEQFKQIPTVTPQQQDLLSQLIGGLQGNLGQGFETIQQQLGNYALGESPMEQMAMRQFQESILPQLGETYAGLNATSGSGFQQALGQAGAGLSENLAGLRQQQQQQGLSNLMSLLSPALGTQTFATGMQSRQPSIFEQLAPLFGTIGGAATPPLIRGAFGGFRNPFMGG